MTICALRYEGKDLNLASAAGRLPCGPSAPSFNILRRIKQNASDRGIWRFDDMFAWAERLLAKHPEVTEFVRWRFPTVFIDEMQDTSEHQGHLLSAIFPSSLCLLCQRYGDSNQAIFDYGQTKATTDPFPSGDIRSITNSKRFGAEIALGLGVPPDSPAGPVTKQAFPGPLNRRRGTLPPAIRFGFGNRSRRHEPPLQSWPSNCTPVAVHSRRTSAGSNVVEVRGGGERSGRAKSLSRFPRRGRARAGKSTARGCLPALDRCYADWAGGRGSFFSLSQ